MALWMGRGFKQVELSLLSTSLRSKEMNKFHIYKDIAEYYRWRLVASNGEKVAASEAYASKAGAIESANKVKVWAGTAVVVDDTIIKTLVRLLRNK